MTRSPRADALAVLEGRPVPGYPCFSGLINVTAEGLAGLGLDLSQVHSDASDMAAAAASTCRISPFGSAVVPLDLCVEAELLGADVDFGSPGGLQFPKVSRPLAGSVTELTVEVPPDPARCERVSTVVEAIGILKADVGDEVAVGAWVPGPFTLATLIVDLPGLLSETRRQPGAVEDLLKALVGVLEDVGRAYGDAGADFLTVHEMGGSPGFIGPGPFEELVLPRLRDLLGALPAPRVLSICGRVGDSMGLLRDVGAEAISVDQSTDLASSREILGPGVPLFGNIDPVGVLASSSEADVRSAVAAAISAGVDAVWPGCDLLPDLPASNLTAMVAEAARHERAA